MSDLRSVTLLTLWLLFSSASHGGISVDRSIIEFEPAGEYFTDISVYNDAKSKAYVNVSVFEILNPGQPSEKRQPLTDPGKALLVTTPSRLTLEPRQSSPVRLLNLDEEHKSERIYRVLVEPVSGRLKGEQDGVKLLVSYELLVIIRPVRPVIKILAQRTGKTIRFYNAGNTNVYLEEGKQCAPGKNRDCQTIRGDRLYAGASWKTELPQAATVEFTINTGGEKIITQSFDGQDTLPRDAPSPP